MVVKTDLCAFSEYRIYPGHGIKYIRRDGQPVLISSSKCKSMVHQRKKPAKLMWTQAWRRLNKKGKEEGIFKKRTRKAAKIQRAIVGASLDEIKKKRLASKPKSVATEAALKEVKDRAKAGGAPLKKPSIATVPKKKDANLPKVTKPIQSNSRGGAKR